MCTMICRHFSLRALLFGVELRRLRGRHLLR